MKTVVYVDGLNLYYGVLRGTTFKWLDLYALFQDHVLGAATHVETVRYYTAPVKGSASDDPASPWRQQTYLRALKAYHGDHVEIVQGSIVRTTPGTSLICPHAWRAGRD
jgi:6-hydroxy-3-succinoylpyridine 3-monooxygenase